MRHEAASLAGRKETNKANTVPIRKNLITLRHLDAVLYRTFAADAIDAKCRSRFGIPLDTSSLEETMTSLFHPGVVAVLGLVLVFALRIWRYQALR